MNKIVQYIFIPLIFVIKLNAGMIDERKTDLYYANGSDTIKKYTPVYESALFSNTPPIKFRGKVNILVFTHPLRISYLNSRE